MHKSRLPHSPKILIPLLLLWVFLFTLMPRTGKFGYDYKKGSPWTYETLVAQFDFPILKTQEQLSEERAEAGESVIPYYRFSDATAQTNIVAAEALDMDGYSYMKQLLVSTMNSLYSKGIMSDSGTDEAGSGVIFVQKDKRASKIPSSDVYTISTAKSKLLSEAMKAYPGTNVDSVLNTFGVYELIVPDLVYDKETTELVHAENVDYISPTTGFVNSGQLIVSKGEIVTAEIEQMLDSYKAEYESTLGYSGPRIRLWSGNAVIALLIVLILFFSLYYTSPEIFGEFSKYIYIIFIFALASAAALVVEKRNPGGIYLVPFTLTALYLLAFFKRRVVLVVYFISLLPLLVFSRSGIELYIMFISAGVATIYFYRYFSRGWLQFVMSLISFFVIATAYFGFRLLDDTRIFANFSNIFYLFFGSLLAVAGYPLVYLFERFFGLVSNSRLKELCDTNNKLLVELAQKAPGTFQHCLQVMNMSEAVANEIDANSLLAKTGALYHDIGKMNNPQCFIENQTLGVDYHKGLSPKESAIEIIRHVPDGVEIAQKNNLPQFIIDFIITHHGTSCTGYFYNKYLNDGGDPSDTEDFFYKGKKPWTKEQSIVMLCDTLEAASRSLKDTSPDAFDRIVDDIVDAKLSSGQLSDSSLTLKELQTVKEKLKSYLSQMYHDRIAYPKRNV